jgi:hypothetical protein
MRAAVTRRRLSADQLGEEFLDNSRPTGGCGGSRAKNHRRRVWIGVVVKISVCHRKFVSAESCLPAFRPLGVAVLIAGSGARPGKVVSRS